jgi:two-component system chemotaxis response regulator CheY
MSIKGKSVLIIDDMKLVRMRLRQLCEKLGFVTITEAVNGKEAWESLRAMKSAPDIILTDYNMPDMNGMEFLNLTRKEDAYAKTPVVFITSESDKSLILNAVMLGATDYVIKPFQDDQLGKKITNLLSNS